MVTAKGSPSGTATTIIVTPIINAYIANYRVSMLKNSAFPNKHMIDQFTDNAKKVKIATIVPTFPISSASPSSFY